MPFPFSFKFQVPGLSNPFTNADSASETSRSVDRPRMYGTVKANDIPRRPISPCLAPPEPLAKKRGWVPSSSEISVPTAVETSTNGYLDTPAKYRDMAQSSDDEIEEMVADLPPPKRRKTLAGSIVSTAMSAALIGTAVGLTVYRLWRNRGKHPEALPPPPYEQGEWVPPSDELSETLTTQVTPPTPQQKSRKRHERRQSTAKRPLARPKKVLHRPVLSQAVATVPTEAPPANSASHITPEVNLGPSTAEEGEEADLDEHMDWIGDQLSILIEEGRRALGTEIVVMSESKEDEVDDGLGAWVDDDHRLSGSTTYGSLRGRRKARPSNIGIVSPPPSYMSPPSTPHRSRLDASHSRQPSFVGLSVPSSPRTTSRRQSISSARSFAESLHEDEDTLESSELKEAMKRAREAYMQRKSQAAQSA